MLTVNTDDTSNQIVNFCNRGEIKNFTHCLINVVGYTNRQPTDQTKITLTLIYHAYQHIYTSIF